MSAKFKAVSAWIAGLAAAGATTSWTLAVCQALPRLTAGPICSARQDAWLLTAHCPACFAALGFSAVFLAAALTSARPPRSALQSLTRR